MAESFRAGFVLKHSGQEVPFDLSMCFIKIAPANVEHPALELCSVMHPGPPQTRN